MAAVSASVEALLLKGADPAQERLLANVASETSRLGRLVGGLLRTARLDQGEALRPQIVDLKELCERELERAAERSSLSWELRWDPVVPRHVVLDVDATREPLANLLDNARRHAVTSVVVAAWTERAHLFLQVADDGPGLPAGAEERAFDRFVTLDGRGGSGLGLAIARDLIRRQSGDLLYGGKAFLMVLPVTVGDGRSVKHRLQRPSAPRRRI